MEQADGFTEVPCGEQDMPSYWQYRRVLDGNQLSIAEVHFTADHRVYGFANCSECNCGGADVSVDLEVDSPDTLKKILVRLEQALARPVIHGKTLLEISESDLPKQLY